MCCEFDEKMYLDAQNIKQFWYRSSALEFLLIPHTDLTTHGNTNSSTYIWYPERWRSPDAHLMAKTSLICIFQWIKKNFFWKRKITKIPSLSVFFKYILKTDAGMRYAQLTDYALVCPPVTNWLLPFWKRVVPTKHCSTMYRRFIINFLNHFKCFCGFEISFPAKTNRCTLFNCFFYYNLCYGQNRQVTSRCEYVPHCERFELQLCLSGEEGLLTNFPMFHGDRATSTTFSQRCRKTYRTDLVYSKCHLWTCTRIKKPKQKRSFSFDLLIDLFYTIAKGPI